MSLIRRFPVFGKQLRILGRDLINSSVWADVALLQITDSSRPIAACRAEIRNEFREAFGRILGQRQPSGGELLKPTFLRRLNCHGPYIVR
jgi:hypothetical protein